MYVDILGESTINQPRRQALSGAVELMGYDHAMNELCRSKDFDFDVLMMPYEHDVLMPYEYALLKLRSRQKSKRFKIHHQEDL